jgi:hypothetical protein
MIEKVEEKWERIRYFYFYRPNFMPTLRVGIKSLIGDGCNALRGVWSGLF